MESDLGRAGLTTVFSELVRLETELWDAVEGQVRRQHGVALGSYEAMRRGQQEQRPPRGGGVLRSAGQPR